MITTSRYPKEDAKKICLEMKKLGLIYIIREKKNFEKIKKIAKKKGKERIIFVEDSKKIKIYNIIEEKWEGEIEIKKIKINEEIYEFEKVEGFFKKFIDDFYGGEGEIKEKENRTTIIKNKKKIGEIIWKEK